jgi:hypothetical protein
MNYERLMVEIHSSFFAIDLNRRNLGGVPGTRNSCALQVIISNYFSKDE